MIDFEDEFYFETHDVYCSECGKLLTINEYEEFHDLCEDCWNWNEEQHYLDEEYFASLI